MNCFSFRELLDNYEELDENQLKELECHAESCEECRGELEFFRSIIQTTASIPMINPPEDLLDKINARIDKEPAVIRTGSRILYSIKSNARRYASVAACLAVGLAVAVNSGYIKDRLTDNSDDGIIRTTSNTVDNSSAETNVESSHTAEDPVNEINADDTKEPEKTAKPSENTPFTVRDATAAKPAKTAAPVKRKPAAVKPAAVALKPPEAPVVTAVPEAAAAPENTVPEAEQATPTVMVRELGNYKIVQSYALPEKQTADVKPVPTEEPDVEDYSLRSENYQIAMGNYSTQDNSVSPAQTISDKIIISSADAEAVSELMSRLGITFSNGYYMTTMNKFHELLALMDEAGIAHDYIQQYSTGAKITFKLVLRQ